MLDLISGSAQASTPDRVRRWSEELAADPASRVFLPLGDALRKQGELDLALRVALRGLERHPYDADAHDLLARVAADRGEWERAADEWEMALRLAPGHHGALKGTGFLHFRAGRLAEAEQALSAVGGDDPAVASALTMVRARLAAGETGAAAPEVAATPAHQADEPPTEARHLFASTLAAGEAALLLDSDGFVIAGRFTGPDGRDAADEVGAQLSGVTDEATRAMRHLGLGAWTSLTIETEHAVVTLAPARANALLMVAAGAAVPLGYLHRLAAKAMARAEQWLGGAA